MSTPNTTDNTSDTVTGDVPGGSALGGDTLVPGDTFTTGELRAALQAIVFVRLAGYHGPGFTEGTIVAAQYWGAGKVVLTRLPDSATITLVAHQIHGSWIQAVETQNAPIWPTEIPDSTVRA